MWEIIHTKIWNEEYKKEESKGFRANGNHIAKFSSKPNNKPQPVDALTPAYGVLLYQKLTDTLGSGLTVLRQKAVRTCCELYTQKKQHIIRGVQASVIPALMKAFKDPDMDVRRHALLATSHIASIPHGRNALLEEPIVDALMDVVKTNTDSEVIQYAFRCFQGLHSMKGLKQLVDKAIPLFINSFRVEEENPTADEETAKIHIEALRAMAMVLKSQAGHAVAHEEKVVAVLCMLLICYRQVVHEQVFAQQVILEVALVMSRLCFRREGIQEGVRWKIIHQLVPLLSIKFDAQVVEEDGVTRSLLETVAQSLMFLTLNVEGKEHAVESDIVPALVTLIKDRGDSIRSAVMINLLKITSAVSERPDARKGLQPLVPVLATPTINQDEKHISLLTECYERAHAAVTWEP